MLKRNKTNMMRAACLTLVALLSAGNLMANSLDKSVVLEKELAAESATSQKKVDRFAEEALDMAADYKITLRVIEQLQIYNNQLEILVESQEKEMASIQKQMDTIDETERGVVPLMNEMIATLDRFVQLDLPFEKEERLEKVNKLRNNMIRADYSNSEKYRAIMERYQAELGYGESMSAYDGSINMGGTETKVNFLRFGRILLTYLTLDGQNAGYYNQDSGNFEPLPSEYIRSIEMGIKIANKQAAYELVKMPVPVAKGAN